MAISVVGRMRMVGVALLLSLLASSTVFAQVGLTGMAVEDCLAATHSKFRITNDAGETINYTWTAYGGGSSGSGSVGPEHTSADRFTNPYYFYVPFPPAVTVIINWQTASGGASGSQTKSSGTAVSATSDPTVTCPGSITVNNDPGKAGAVVTWSVSHTGDAVSCTPASGSFFPIGTTKVTCTSTTYSPLGTVCKQASCSFDVTVNPNWPGVGMSGCVCWDGTYRLSVYNGGGPGWIAYDVYGKAGSFTDLGYFNAGETKYVYLGVGTASWTIRKFVSLDGATWSQQGGTHTANTSDSRKSLCWSITGCPGDQSGVYGTPVTWVEPVATCQCCGGCSIPPTSQTHRPGDLFPIGTTTVTYTWTSPNTVYPYTRTCSFNVVVEKPTLLVIAEDKVKQFDEQPFTDFTVSYEGFVAGDGPALLGGALTFSGDAVGAVNVGAYTITPGGLTSPNYNIIFVDGTLTIRPYYRIVPAGEAGTFVDLGIGGGAGAFQGDTVSALYRVGEPIHVLAEVFDYYGNPVSGLSAWVTLIQLHEDGRETIWYFHEMKHNQETGLHELIVPTAPADGVPIWYPAAGLPAGYYKLVVGIRDGIPEENLIQIVVE